MKIVERNPPILTMCILQRQMLVYIEGLSMEVIYDFSSY